VVCSKPLQADEIRAIVDLLLQDLRRRLADRRIQVEVTDKAKTFLGNKGYDRCSARAAEALPAARAGDPDRRQLIPAGAGRQHGAGRRGWCELKITTWLQRRPRRDRERRPRSIATSTLDGSRQHAEIARRTATGPPLRFSA